ncbi:MAG: diguanylate cyclase, partial [Anaerolineae bacterium]|nr:diguanylate cyclase [Anaerolineae bacterium]
IDDFKRVNDTLGHEAGDEVLQQFAHRIRDAVDQMGGDDALLARFGGDEFVILIQDGDVRGSATRLAEKLVAELGRPIVVQDRQVFLGTSIGITLFPEDASGATALMKNGDIAMYQAKVAGKNCYRFYSRAMDQAVERRVRMEQELRGAWERGELSLMYQPVFRMADSRIVGAEALLRWQHPELGMVAPSVFIDVAEQSGLIEIIGPRVLRAACAAAARWGGRGYARLEELLTHEKPAAVWVTVPPHQHGAIEYTLIAANIPFLVEKPLSANRSTAVEIAEVIEQKQLLVAVGYNWRALDTLPALREHLAQLPARMVIGAFHVNTPAAVWWRHQAESGGQMVEQATHLIDLARLLLGDATVISAQGVPVERAAYPDADIAGVSAALLRFQNGAIGTFTATCILAQSGGVQLQLISENALVTLTRDSVTYQIGDQRQTQITQRDTYEAQNRAFLAAIKQNNAQLMLCSYADALITHHICHDIADHIAAQP